MEETQLAWRFDRVDICPEFPLGVKAMYKAYVSDAEVYEFLKTTSNPLGYEPVLAISSWEPRINPAIGVLKEGLRQLKRFPKGNFSAAKFTDQHVEYMENCMARVRKFFVQSPAIVGEWESFAELYPTTDDANKWAQDRGLHIPLKDQLFPVATVPMHANSAVRKDQDDVTIVSRVVYCLPIVRQKSTKSHAVFLPARVMADVAQQKALTEGRISLMDLRNEMLKEMLSLQEEYEECTCEELITRIELRTGRSLAKKGVKAKLVER
jgi:hypothetical protein